VCDDHCQRIYLCRKSEPAAGGTGCSQPLSRSDKRQSAQTPNPLAAAPPRLQATAATHLLA
jgi:hypothetical protein